MNSWILIFFATFLCSTHFAFAANVVECLDYRESYHKVWLSEAQKALDDAIRSEIKNVYYMAGEKIEDKDISFSSELKVKEPEIRKDGQYGGKLTGHVPEIIVRSTSGTRRFEIENKTFGPYDPAGDLSNPVSQEDLSGRPDFSDFGGTVVPNRITNSLGDTIGWSCEYGFSVEFILQLWNLTNGVMVGNIFQGYHRDVTLKFDKNGKPHTR